MTNQFWKGLLTTLISIVVVAFSQTPIVWATLIITLIGTALVYFGKNAFPALQSDSPSGSISLRNIVSALLIAIGTAVVESVALIAGNGVIDWVILGKVVAYTSGTYLLTTFFAPPYDPTPKRLFASKTYIRSLAEGAAILAFLILPLTASAQGPLDGFFKPKAGTPAIEVKAEGDQTLDWYIRPAAGLSAIQFTYDKENKVFNSATFSAAGIGLGLQHYVEHNGVLVNNYGVNALLMLDGSGEQGGMAIAGTVNALQFVNVGAGWNFGNKQFFILTGAVYNF